MTQEEMQAIRSMMEDVTKASEQRTEKRMQGMIQENNKALAQMIDDKLEPLKTQMDSMQGKMDKMQKDIDHITEQVDIAYNWVDRIDLRVKTLERG